MAVILCRYQNERCLIQKSPLSETTVVQNDCYLNTEMAVMRFQLRYFMEFKATVVMIQSKQK